MTTVDHATLGHNDLTALLAEQIEDVIQQINEANAVLLETGNGTSTSDIDKALKDSEKLEDAEVKKAAEKAEKAKEAFKKAQTDARNLYRTKVLGEEASAADELGSDEKKALKDKRATIMNAITIVKDLAETNKLPKVKDWAENLSVPMVGRQQSSTVGQSKPRAFVHVGETVYQTFGEAAKALSTELSTEDTVVSVSSGDLISAWAKAGKPEGQEFTYKNTPIKVVPKPKKATA